MPEKGRENMTKYGLFIDISEEPVDTPFDIDLQIITWNGFQGKESDWAACLVKHATENLEFSIIFPRDKPYKSFGLRSYSKESNTLTDFTGIKDVVEVPGQSLTWKIPDPRIRYSYRIVWQW